MPASRSQYGQVVIRRCTDVLNRMSGFRARLLRHKIPTRPSYIQLKWHRAAPMTFDEYSVELDRLVIETDSLRTLASQYVNGADVEGVALHVMTELSLLCPELIAGIQELRAYANRAIRYHVLDLIKDQNGPPQHLDTAAATRHMTEHSAELDFSEPEQARKLLRTALDLLDRQEQAVIAAMLQEQPIGRTTRRLNASLEVARRARERCLNKLRDIVEVRLRTSHPRSEV